MRAGDEAVLVFDGACGLCRRSIDVLRRLGPRGVRLVASADADLNALGLTRAECDEAVQWVGPSGERASGGLAIARCLRRCRRPWSLAGALVGSDALARPREAAYSWVAAHRGTWPLSALGCRESRV